MASGQSAWLVGTWWPHHGSIKVDRSTGPERSRSSSQVPQNLTSSTLSAQFCQFSFDSVLRSSPRDPANTLVEHAPSFSWSWSQVFTSPGTFADWTARAPMRRSTDLKSAPHFLTSSPPPALPDVRFLTVSTSSVLSPLCLPFPPAPAARASAPKSSLDGDPGPQVPPSPELSRDYRNPHIVRNPYSHSSYVSLRQ